MLDSGLLSLIARPTDIDPAARFRAGQQNQRDIKTQGIDNLLKSAQTESMNTSTGTAKRTEQTAVNKIALTNGFSYASTAALFSNNPEKQNEMLDLGLSQMREAGIPQGIAIFEKLKATIDPVERAKSLAEIKALGIQGGFIKDPTAQRDYRTKLEKNVEAAGYKKGTPEYEEKIEAEMAKGQGLKVQSSVILDDGTTVQSTSEGVRVFDKNQKPISGPDAAKAIKEAKELEVQRAIKKSGGKRTAVLKAEGELKGDVAADVKLKEAAIKKSSAAFDQLAGIDEKIGLYGEIITAIDNKASTGYIESKLPTIRTASLELKNLQGRLGLNVIQNTTFGSLSEAELKFALDTAIPTNLRPTELRAWVIRKRAAQEKLRNYIEEAAIFLGSKNAEGKQNTIPDWLRMQKGKRDEDAAGANVINFDAKGNIIP